MEFRVLGPLEVVDRGESVPVGAPRTRAVLAILLTSPSRLVSLDTFVDELWPERPPPTSRALVRGYVSRARRALRSRSAGGSAADRLVTRKPGYLLSVEDEELDLWRFQRLLAGARAAGRAGDLDRSLALYQAADRCWRGSPFVDVPTTTTITAAVVTLTELRLTSQEDLYQTAVQLGRAADVLARLVELVTLHPLRERLVAVLMRAFHRTGRTAAALDAFHRTKHRLADEFGIGPGRELQRLYVAILRGDDSH